jgi:NO-binding membrane sensor protein with MHYT domain
MADLVEMEKTWNTSLVALSVLIAILGAYTSAIMVGAMQRASSGAQRQLTAFLAAISLGVGTVWSMHFIGMLAISVELPAGAAGNHDAFEPGMDYDVVTTVLSAAVVAVLARIAIHVAFAKRDPRKGSMVHRVDPGHGRGSRHGHDDDMVPLRTTNSLQKRASAVRSAWGEEAGDDDGKFGVTTATEISGIDGGDGGTVAGTDIAATVGSDTVLDDSDSDGGRMGVVSDDSGLGVNKGAASDAGVVARAIDTPPAAAAAWPARLAAWARAVLSPSGHTPYWRLLTAGLFLGAGVTVMHYLGMAAASAGSYVTMRWNWVLVALSALNAVSVSCVGMFLFDRFSGPVWDMVLAVVIAAAVLTMHFTGMLAVTYWVDPRDVPAAIREATVAEAAGNLTNETIAFVVTLAAFLTSFALLSATNILVHHWIRHLDQAVAERTAEVSAERQKADNLLFNVLPRHIAERLKERAAGVADAAADAERFPHAIVLFVDIVGFTQFASAEDPVEVLAMLSALFNAFDVICEAHGVTKIKTIGDACVWNVLWEECFVVP